VGIHEVDLDSQFRLPRERYDLVCLLGILYHLKNPYFVLEQLARRTRYCVLSTRVARQTADGRVRLDGAPLAYLLAPDECNNDATNFWIFSMPGLLRLVDRCGWNVVAQRTVGDTRRSNPSANDHDERAFLLLESRHAMPVSGA
jgi:tRNA (mo5U34)-methyltransferase